MNLFNIMYQQIHYLVSVLAMRKDQFYTQMIQIHILVNIVQIMQHLVNLIQIMLLGMILLGVI